MQHPTLNGCLFINDTRYVKKIHIKTSWQATGLALQVLIHQCWRYLYNDGGIIMPRLLHDGAQIVENSRTKNCTLFFDKASQSVAASN